MTSPPTEWTVSTEVEDDVIRQGENATFNLFVLQGMTRHRMSDIAKAALPMFPIMVPIVAVLVAWPDLASWLPETAWQGPGG